MPERFLRIPHIRQKAEADCLAAYAAMLLEAAGFRANYDRLLRLLGTSKIGTPSHRIELLSRLYSDLIVIYRAGGVEDIFDFIDSGYPVCVFVATLELPYWSESLLHAVVVVGYSDQDFYLHDPAFGNAPQTVTHGDLQLARDAFSSKLAVVQRKQQPL
jgi:ABC-type bacteriocin/lantibiotic exporter with double-glycine peptidase domain